MSRSIKVSEEVYDQLRELQGKRESFSQTIARLLALVEKIGKLKDILEELTSFALEQEEQIKTLGTAHTTALLKGKEM